MSSLQLPHSPFFDVVKRHNRTPGPPIKGNLVKFPNAVGRTRGTGRGQASLERGRSDALGLSNVPYLAGSVLDPKLRLLGELFGIPELLETPNGIYKMRSGRLCDVTLPSQSKPHAYVTAELRPASVKLRVLSPEARRRRLYNGVKQSSRPLPRPVREALLPGSFNDLGAFVHDLTRVLSVSDLFVKDTRGVIAEFSEKSRGRLQSVCADLQALGIKPGFMFTLTYPGAWQSAVPDGKIAKRHLQAMRKRLSRYLEAQGFSDWSALWFTEFQRRGAPHFHIIGWGPTLQHADIRRIRRWSLDAWANIISHPDPIHRAKGRKAGTKFEKMRRDHFGYAATYAKKMTQKVVPEGYRNVGRFWGLWNFKLPSPPVLASAMSFESLMNLADSLCDAVVQHSRWFPDRILNNCLGGVSSYSSDFKPDSSFTVFGVAAVLAAKASLSP